MKSFGPAVYPKRDHITRCGNRQPSTQTNVSQLIRDGPMLLSLELAFAAITQQSVVVLIRLNVRHFVAVAGVGFEHLAEQPTLRSRRGICRPNPAAMETRPPVSVDWLGNNAVQMHSADKMAFGLPPQLGPHVRLHAFCNSSHLWGAKAAGPVVIEMS